MFTERRKADREAMAKLIAAHAVAEGATVERDHEWTEMCPRAIMLHIRAPGGAVVSVDLDGDNCQPDTHVITWNVRDGLPFNPAIGDVNPYHGRKAQRVCEGFHALLACLCVDIAAFKSGAGYADSVAADAA